MRLFARKKKQPVFQPSLGTIRLEDRVVLNATTITAPQVSTLLTGVNQVGQPGTTLAAFSGPRLNVAFRAPTVSNFTALNRNIGTAVATLAANRANLVGGQFTPQALATLQAFANAPAVARASQSALLAASNIRVTPTVFNPAVSFSSAIVSPQLRNIALRTNPALLANPIFQSSLNAALAQNTASTLSALGNSTFTASPLSSLGLSSVNGMTVNPLTGQLSPVALGSPLTTQLTSASGSLVGGASPIGGTTFFNATGLMNPLGGIGTFTPQVNTSIATASPLFGVPQPGTSVLVQPRQPQVFPTGIDTLTGLPSVNFDNMPGFFATGLTTNPV